MTADEFIKKVKDLIAEGRTSEALDMLQEMGKTLQIKFLENEAVLLAGRYKEAARSINLGVIKQEDFSIQVNNVQLGIMDLIERYEKGELMPLYGAKSEQGRVVHNIPSLMQKDKESICSVRIAKDDEQLLKNFPLSDASVPESVEISPTMSVELVDPYGGEVFAIRRVSPVAEQPIVQHTFTEWDFAIRPLKEGKHLLYLYAHFISSLNGEKTQRTIAFKRDIEITTEAVAPTIKWHSTNIAIKGESGKEPWKKSIFSFFILKGLNVAKAIGVLIALAGLGYLVYRLVAPIAPPKVEENPPIATAERFAVTIRIDPGLEKPTVLINQDTIHNWAANSDTSEIYLPEYKAGKYFIAVRGENGRCSQLVHLSKDSTRFNLDCTLRQPPLPETPITPPPPAPRVDEFEVSLITPFRMPIVEVDRQNKGVLQSVNYREQFKTTVKVTRGMHRFKVSDQSERYNCDAVEVDIRQPQTLNFECLERIDSFKVTLMVLGENATLRPEHTWVELNDVKLPNTGVVKGKRMEFIFWAPKGNHSVVVNKTGNHAPLCPLTFDLQSDRSVDYHCKFSIVH